jgi:hypothetical protein
MMLVMVAMVSFVLAMALLQVFGRHGLGIWGRLSVRLNQWRAGKSREHQQNEQFFHDSPFI